MKEDFLQSIWELKKLPYHMKTTLGKDIHVLSFGKRNKLHGPDFSDVELRIDGMVYCGSAEVHLKSSDWYLHEHQIDPNYQKIILHIVWEHDVEVFDKKNIPFPTLELKDHISDSLVKRYNALLYPSKTFINCEKSLYQVDGKIIKEWLKTLFLIRLKRKTKEVYHLLKSSNNDWEEVLFRIMAKSFGLKVNDTIFLNMAKSFPFQLVRKCNTFFQLEALFLGQLRLLEADFLDVYYQELRQEYTFLKKKFKLKNDTATPPNFYGLRPFSFPTIRTSQLANLYALQKNLFSKVIQTYSLPSYHKLIETKVSEYWKSHYTFDKESKYSEKQTSRGFINTLVLNTFLPVLYAYGLSIDQDNTDDLTQLASEIPLEKNSIVSKFKPTRIKLQSALDSQAILELYNNYCLKNNCFNCSIGKDLLYGSSIETR